ncbi:hypothetical protein PR202_gb28696 [Eleusine coracana subsp. coracana]|uniref:Haloacid dehalogenase-like hydrolase domain-containing protein 3 n=1 Tax=Eleusine coracana subsp. coracana TaxID=191504 RepID=A0AAV5FZH1_ELECO|nr:hypothetical protein PR202_gb28696 [Eleusine coracana subsp. coracana]
MPPAAAVRWPFIWRAPAAPVAVLRAGVRRSGMRRCLSAGAGSGGHRPPAYGGLLLDAGGTLLQVARPVAETYAFIGRRYGSDETTFVALAVPLSRAFHRTYAVFLVPNVRPSTGVTMPKRRIMEGFKRAFAAPWPKTLRYQGDGRPFWRIVVAEATGCTDDDYFEEVYQHYAHGDAWRLPVGADTTLHELKDAGVKLAVVSNFDTRLWKLLKDLNVSDMFDAIVVSSEVGFEKPAPEIFKIALAVLKDQIGVEASKAVHVGDDETADKAGANAVGLECWLWGEDVKTFSDIRHRILTTDQQ